MLVQQMNVLGDIAVVEIGDPGIKQDIEQKSEIEQVQVKTVINKPHRILHRAVDPENPERLHQEVQEEQQGEIGEEFLLHLKFVRKM